VTKIGGSGQIQPNQPRKMHTADVMDVAGDHARAVHGDDAAQVRQGQIWAMRGQQPWRVQPTAPVATVADDNQHRETGRDLVKDETSGHGRILVGRAAAPLRYDVALNRL
jgi:hypothetical protein